jgi:hypothetical protein
LRISVSNWSTKEEDIDRSADAILAALREEDGLIDPGRGVGPQGESPER